MTSLKKTSAVLLCSLLLTGCSRTYITLPDYKNLDTSVFDNAEYPEVSDAELLQRVAHVYTEYVDSEPRAITDGDFIRVSYSANFDGELYEEEDCILHVGTIGSSMNTALKEFDNSLLNHVPGDSYTWSIIFPDDYSDEYFQNKPLDVSITIDAVLEQKVPEVTDEMIQKFPDTECTTVSEYLDEERKEWEASWSDTFNSNLSISLWNQVMTDSIVEKYPKKVMEQAEKIVSDWGIADDDTESAVKYQAKEILAAQAIIKNEHLNYSDDEYSDWITSQPDLKNSSYVEELFQIQYARNWLTSLYSAEGGD